MPKWRMVAIAATVLVVFGGISGWLLMRTDSSTPSHHVNAGGAASGVSSAPVKTLSPENVVVLQKIGSRNEKFKALVPRVRTGEMFEALGSGEVAVDIAPETFQVHELYATVDAKLAGAATSRVTFYLQPSDGLWLIAGQTKG